MNSDAFDLNFGVGILRVRDAEYPGLHVPIHVDDFYAIEENHKQAPLEHEPELGADATAPGDAEAEAEIELEAADETEQEQELEQEPDVEFSVGGVGDVELGSLELPQEEDELSTAPASSPACLLIHSLFHLFGLFRKLSCI